MSLAIDKNNKVSSINARSLITFSKNKISPQASYAVLGSTSYTVGDNDLILFISGSGAFTLNLPAADVNSGRDLFVVQRGSQVISTNPNIIDIDQDANGNTTQSGLLTNVPGHWAHLVSNGSKWVVISKFAAAP